MENLKPLYLVAPPCEGMMEGFPGSLTVMKNYLDRTLGQGNPSYIVDLEATRISDVGNQIRTYLPREEEIIVGITATTATYQRALETARQVKAYNPKAQVIIGGHHVKQRTNQDEIVLRNHPEIDYVCLGDGERTLEALMKGVPKHEIPNVSYLDQGTYTQNQIQNLGPEEMNIPFRIYGTKTKAAKMDEGVSYPSSRGCHFKCAFCAVGKDKIRTKSIDDKLSDLKYLVTEKGYDKVAFEDNFFAADLRQTKDLLTRITEEQKKDPAFKFNWTCQTRADHLKNDNSGITLEEMVGLIADSGANKVYLGIENFDPDMIVNMAKIIPPRRNLSEQEREVQRAFYQEKYLKPAFQAIEEFSKYANVETGVLFILGRPEETARTEDVNIEALRRIQETIQHAPGRVELYPSLSVLYPGTFDANEFIAQTNPHWTSLFEDFTAWEQGTNSDPERDKLQDFIRRNFAHGSGGVPWGILDSEALKRREFKVDQEKIERVQHYLEKLRAVGPGIGVHDYTLDLQKSE